MINNLKKKLFISVLFFILIVSMIFPVFASSGSVTYYNSAFPDNVIDVISNSEYYTDDYYVLGCRWSYRNYNNYYVFFIKKTDTLIVTFDSGSSWSVNEVCYYTSYTFNSDGTLSSSPTGLVYEECNSSRFFGNDLYNDVFFLNNGTFYKSDGSVFFQQTPLRKVLIQAEVTKNKEVITTIVGLAKSLIPLLICLVGFWKAWRLLSRILFKA